MTHAIRSFLALTALVLLVSPFGATRAADDRPKELPYQTPGEIPALDATELTAPRKVVVIHDQSLNPRLVQLGEGEHIAWLSYSKIPSQIVFERETAKAMVCHSLVNFSIKDDEIVSGDIHAGEFASFCQLKPGRYKYFIRRTDPGSNAASAAKRLDGEIIVTAKAPAEAPKK